MCVQEWEWEWGRGIHTLSIHTRHNSQRYSRERRDRRHSTRAAERNFSLGIRANHETLVELDALRQGQVLAKVDGAGEGWGGVPTCVQAWREYQGRWEKHTDRNHKPCRAAHVLLPGVRSRLTATASFLLTTKGATNLSTTGADVDVDQPAIGPIGSNPPEDILHALGEEGRAESLGHSIVHLDGLVQGGELHHVQDGDEELHRKEARGGSEKSSFLTSQMGGGKATGEGN